MDATLNGEDVSLPERQEGWRLDELLAHQLGLDSDAKGVAVAVDDTVIPRSLWSQHEVAPGSRIEVIRATQGG